MCGSCVRVSTPVLHSVFRGEKKITRSVLLVSWQDLLSRGTWVLAILSLMRYLLTSPPACAADRAFISRSKQSERPGNGRIVSFGVGFEYLHMFL